MKHPDRDHGRQHDREHDWEHDWDDVADVICVGSGPGLIGYAAICGAEGLDVVRADLPAGAIDPEIAAYLAAMTEDLREGPIGDDHVPTRAAPVETAGGRGATVETFAGAALRLWSARCLASPPGVMVTHVPDHVLAPMRTDAGELITAAVVHPGADQDAAASGDTLAGLIFEWGRLAGAALDGPQGRRLVRAEAGLAFSVGPAGGAAPGPAPAGATVALVGRRAGRFARLEMLVADTREGDGD